MIQFLKEKTLSFNLQYLLPSDSLQIKSYGARKIGIIFKYTDLVIQQNKTDKTEVSSS